jgi:cellulose synthase/poly-beta-1,6-N-acetylglucosamine synthase-like glycosyltransferase
MLLEILNWAYVLTHVLLAAFGLNLLVALIAAVMHRQPKHLASPPTEWPHVLVQLPIFNERYVVERLIDAAAALDYPAEKLHIQVLDDSTDETAQLARARVAHHRVRGVNVSYLHRLQRTGFKAGALAAGLAAETQAEYVTIFDADFVPPRDFLRRLLPGFVHQPRLGLVQARWEHLNAQENIITRAQALALDSYFTVEQVARSGARWLMNFNGSAGVWRRACIEEAGGWHGDTLAEDLDLSYRAQLCGWQLAYRVEVAAPAELPPTILAVKRQQFRWAKGSFQVLKKLGGALLAAPLPLPKRFLGVLHLAGYLPHPLVVLAVLLSLPVVLFSQQVPFRWEGLGWLGLVPPLAVVWGQWRLGRSPRNLLDYVFAVPGMIGLAVSNTRAFVEALSGQASEFQRTPKNTREAAYAVKLDWTTWGELALAAYAFSTGFIALALLPALAPVIFLYAVSFGAVGALGVWESFGTRRAQTVHG